MKSLMFIFAAAAGAQVLPVPFGGLSIQTFGMVGIAEGQTARLNVLSPGVQAPAATGILCSALLTFLDDQGSTLKSATVTVAPGKSALLDLDADTDLKLMMDQRKQIRATIQIPPALPPAGTQPVFCNLFPTLEIFDRVTGKTQIIVVETQSIPRIVAVTPRP